MNSISGLVSDLLGGSLRQFTGFVFAITFATYVVLRGPVWGFELKRMLLNEPGAISRRRRATEVASVARDLDIHGQEARLFQALSSAPALSLMPTDPPFDLLVKGVLVLCLFDFAFAHFVLPTGEPGSGVAFLVIAGLRTLYLAIAYRRRRQGSGP